MPLFYPRYPFESIQISFYRPKKRVTARSPPPITHHFPPFCDSTAAPLLTDCLPMWHYNTTHNHGSVVQWIGQRFPVPSMWVRFPPGLAQKNTQFRQRDCVFLSICTRLTILQQRRTITPRQPPATREKLAIGLPIHDRQQMRHDEHTAMRLVRTDTTIRYNTHKTCFILAMI